MKPLDSGLLPRGSETILLADPDPESRKLGAFMLQRRGYNVMEARSTADALDLYASAGIRVDLLLTEILMPPKALRNVPKPGGPELAARLLELQPDLRVLYMSNSDAHSFARHLEIGRAWAFLQKPFTMRSLADKVRQVLDEPRARGAGGGR